MQNFFGLYVFASLLHNPKKEVFTRLLLFDCSLHTVRMWQHLKFWRKKCLLYRIICILGTRDQCQPAHNSVENCKKSLFCLWDTPSLLFKWNQVNVWDHIYVLSYYYCSFLSESCQCHYTNVKQNKWPFNLYLTHAVLHEKEPLFLEQLFWTVGHNSLKDEHNVKFYTAPSVQSSRYLSIARGRVVQS